MHAFIAGQSLTDKTNVWFTENDPSEVLKCGVAFWGKGAITLLKSCAAREIHVICNLESGATHPDFVEWCMKEGTRVTIRQHNDLHAKVYVHTQAAIVSSANASTNGLGLDKKSATANLVEAGIITHDEQSVREINEWFDGLWAKARKITKEDLDAAREQWEKRQRYEHTRKAHVRKRHQGEETKSLVEKLRAVPGYFNLKPLYLAIYTAKPDAIAKQQFKKDREKLQDPMKADFDFFQDWDNAIKDDSTVISAYVGMRGKIEVYKTMSWFPPKRLETSFKNPKLDGKTSRNTYCHQVPTFEQMSLTDDDVKAIKAVLPTLRENEKGLAADGGMLRFSVLENYLKKRPAKRTARTAVAKPPIKKSASRLA